MATKTVEKKLSVLLLVKPLVVHKLPDLIDGLHHMAYKIDDPSTGNSIIYKTLHPRYMSMVDLHTKNR